uniref:J domain-containing protein n=1 Tax=Ditylenchus dipsaci TaxID=166011 RepID=A0A915CNB4_9BILA
MYDVQMMPYFSYFSVVILAYHYVLADKKQDVENHLEMGKTFLSKGQFADALSHYHAAAELDPTDYQIFYRRATVLLATGKMKAALPDLHRVVELKPDFVAGRVQRGNILFKQGNMDDSREDFKFAIKHDPSHSEAKEKLQKISEVQEMIEQANDFFENDDYHNAETLYNMVIEHCHWNPELHRKRSKCRLARGDIQNAIADIRAVAKLVPDSTETYLEMSEMYYEVGDVENSLMQIRECLKLNPDHKLCFPFYKKVKKLAKMREAMEKSVQEQKWTECLKKGNEILKFESKVDNLQLDVFRHTCKCNMKLSHVAEAIQQCTEVLKYGNENDLEILLDRGEAYILNEQFEKAVEDFQKQRNAGKQEINKAYRKLAHKWHPDNYQDENEKARAQEKFMDIASAKEVLSDPEKRQKFDAGEDPLDPQSGGGGHQQGWHQHWGDMPFGGFGQQEGGYSFKFNFG